MNEDMNGPKHNEEAEALWRGRLSPAEQARLQAHAGNDPEALADLEADLALNQALDRLPAAPLSSNFTAQVLQALAVEEARAERVGKPSRLRSLFSLRWGRRLAFAGVALGVAALVMQQQRVATRQEIARQFQAFTQLDGASRVEVFKNFDTIQHLNAGPAQADLELLNLLEDSDK